MSLAEIPAMPKTCSILNRKYLFLSIASSMEFIKAFLEQLFTLSLLILGCFAVLLIH